MIEKVNLKERVNSAKENTSGAYIERSGKNWYATTDDIAITVNAHSYTIITAHRVKSSR